MMWSTSSDSVSDADNCESDAESTGDFEAPVFLGYDGVPVYVCDFSEDYDGGGGPEYFYTRAQPSIYERGVQDVCHVHGLRVFVYGRFENFKKAVPLSYYRHASETRVINGSMCYLMLKWV